MPVVLGRAGVLIGLLASVAGLVIVGTGLRRNRTDLIRFSRQASLLILVGAVVSVVAMEWAILRNDFSVRFLAETHSTRTPFPFNVATLWAGLAGSILLWALVLAGYIAAALHRFRHRLEDRLVAWAAVVMFAVALFFFALMVFSDANPFVTVADPPADGPGPNPLLQNHLLMAFHPPMLYMGYVGFTVPFAFATAALVTGRLGEGWLVETRRWTMVAWGFLTAGIVLGGWWAYEVLGWGGVWGWDPVENASLLPWLTGTAYLHSVMVQERRGMLRVWNLSLLAATFALTIVGTFLTRSGVIVSVHSFTESDIGAWFLAFFALIVLVSVALIGWRGDHLRSPGSIESPVSREGAFLVNNLLFGLFAFAVFLGTVFPLLSEAAQGTEINVGESFFTLVTVPIGLALLFLMAVAPLLPWRRSSGALLGQRLLWPAWVGAAAMVVALVVGARGPFAVLGYGLGGFAAAAAARQLVVAVGGRGVRGVTGRSSGGMVVHLGVVLVAVGLVASGSNARQGEFELREGQTGVIGGHEITYLGTEVDRRPDRNPSEIIRAQVQIDGGPVYEPSIRVFETFNQPVGTPSVRSSFVDDVYLTLVAEPETPGGPATIGVIVQPLVAWIWAGGALMVVGTVLSLLPGGPVRARRDDEPDSDREPSPARQGVAP